LQRHGDLELIGPLLQRLSGFHEVDADDDPAALAETVLRRLRQRAVDDELQWLIESGELSEAATQRRNALFAMRAELKANAPLPPSK
jgi:DNA primase